MLKFVLSLVFGSVHTLASTSDANWQFLESGLESWAALSFDAKFAFQVGDSTGLKFSWVSKDFTLQTPMLGASLSKWPAAVMITGLVADGTMSFDDRANKYLDWWSKNESDPRSQVTLRSLLSFTSGFTSDAYVSCNGSFLECAEQLYHASKHYTYPGKTWAYLGCHLQFAGSMAEAASGIPIQDLFKKYLYDPYNMTATSWAPKKNPEMATGITTTGDDFQNMLARLNTYSVLPQNVTAQMEVDYSKAPVSPSGDGWFGHYGMGHWWECLGYGSVNERAPLPSVCTASHIQAGPGYYGYYPLVDRSGGGGEAGPSRPSYYMQVILQEEDALSGIPEYLRLLAKPIVDVIMSGNDPATANRQSLLNQGGGLIARDITYIQESLKACKCTKGGVFDFGEPYKSLLAHLPPDQKNATRREIAGQGIGLTMAEFVSVQQKLGECTCKGRKGSH